MAICVKHPTRQALYQCRRCNKPICDQCSSETQRFCSTECAASFQDFQSRIADSPMTRHSSFSLFGCLRTFCISIVLVIVIWFALIKLLGTSEPAQMLIEIKRMWRLAF